MNVRKNFSCPCCGFLTLSEMPPGTYEICPVCYWEDDYVQFHNPEFNGGANKESLNEARKNFSKFRASSRAVIQLIRQPLPEEYDDSPDSKNL